MGDTPHKKRKLSHRLFVPPFRFKWEGTRLMVNLDADAAHHLRNVLRLSAGARIAVFNNSGEEFLCDIVELTHKRGAAEVIETTRPQVESPLSITLAQALLKGNAFDRLLTLATELGVARFVPLFTARTVVDLSRADAAERVRRWERVLAEAAAQSERVRVPRMDPPRTLEEFLPSEPEAVRIILAERAGAGRLDEIATEAERGKPVVVLAGPEGGFEPAEVEAARAAGYQAWWLGPRILRAESAGPAAAAILQHALGDMK